MGVRFHIALLLIWTSLARAEIFKGTVLSDHHGQGGHASGMITLAVGNKAYHLYYAEPLPRHFHNSACSDIGAIWCVRARLLPDASRDIVSITCRGRVDEEVHQPWQLVRKYLQVAGMSAVSVSTLLSLRWRTSREFEQYGAKLKQLDLSHYRRFGGHGTCIDVVAVERPNRARLRADGDCYISLAGKPVDLVFDVLRDPTSGRWEIDEIKVE